MTIYEYGVVLGRFQPLHIGHLEYLVSAKERCSRLIIGVTNPNTSKMQFHSADPHRSKMDNNPFSYFQRHEMIHSALCELGWATKTYGIVPADLDDLEYISKCIPPTDRTAIFITVYDAWGDEKANRLREMGYVVEVLWRRDMSQRVTSGTEIRALMRDDRPWRHLVPEGVSSTIDHLDALRSNRMCSDLSGNFTE